MEAEAARADAPADGRDMAPARVVRLANDIAAQFAHEPDDRAAADIAAHIRLFWEPRMTRELIGAVLGPDSGLLPRAADAARLLAARR